MFWLSFLTMLVMVWIWFSSSFLASNSSFWKPWVPWRQAEMSSLMWKACSRRKAIVRSWLFSLVSSWLLWVFGMTGRKEWSLVRKRKQHPGCYKNELGGARNRTCILTSPLIFFSPVRSPLGLQHGIVRILVYVSSKKLIWLRPWLAWKACIFHVFQAGIALYVTYYCNKPGWIHISLIPVNWLLRRRLLSFPPIIIVC